MGRRRCRAKRDRADQRVPTRSVAVGREPVDAALLWLRPAAVVATPEPRRRRMGPCLPCRRGTAGRLDASRSEPATPARTRRLSSSGSVNLRTGKPTLRPGYAASTINHALTVGVGVIRLPRTLRPWTAAESGPGERASPTTGTPQPERDGQRAPPRAAAAEDRRPAPAANARPPVGRAVRGDGLPP